MLKLMYITNDPCVAASAADAGVDRIFIDTEVLGKQERQSHLDSVKSQHKLTDIPKIRDAIGGRSQILVRLNPFYEKTRDEVLEALDYGADQIMLPMWKTASEVEQFCSYVDGKAVTVPLLETKEADEALEEVLKLGCIDELYIGLNDLHLSYGRRFMFELLADGTVDRLCALAASYAVPYGFGGVGRPGSGNVPANSILGEHYRLGSGCVILSRQFCKDPGPYTMDEILHIGVSDIRKKEEEIRRWTPSDFSDNRELVCNAVARVLREMQG